MKRLILLFLVLVVLVNPVNANDWQYTAETMEASIDINSGVIIIPEGGGWEVKDLVIELGLWPRGTNYQEVLFLDEEPEAYVEDGKMIFELEDVEETDVDVIVNGVVEVSENRPEIKRKVDFPLGGLSSELEEYTESTEKINADNEDVIQLSSTIVEGEDDLFKAVYLVGEWVRENIDYELDEYTESGLMDSDWVFENRYGACDEISNMFIAMVRSLGIPARYVSGYAFTDIDDIERFESHAWAEVYFPGYGWVPYDMTYGQFGFVDISHINLGERLDSGESAVEIELVGRDVSLESKNLDIDAFVNELKGSVSSNVDISAEFVKDDVDFGSYNLIKAVIINERDYYIAAPIYLSNNIKAEVFEDNIKYVILKPGEEKIIYWKIKVSDDLQKGYYYTMPFNVYSLDGEEYELSLRVEEGSVYLTEDDVDSMIDELIEERSKTYSSDVDVECAVKEFAYTYENIEVNCSVSNTGNKYLENLNFCFGECEVFDLGIGQKKTFNFNADVEEGMKVSVLNKDVSKTEYLDFEVLDIPQIDFVNLSYPENVKYEDEFTINFGLKKESSSIPQKVVVDVGGKVSKFELNELNGLQMFKINLQGSNLEEGENNFSIYVEFKDLNERNYETEEDLSIVLDEVSFGQRLMIWLNKLDNWLNGLS